MTVPPAPAALLAHAAHGNVLGAPELFLEAGLLVAVGLAVLALRSAWTAPHLAAAATGRLLAAWTAPLAAGAAAVAAVVGAAVWLAALGAGLLAVDEPTENLAPFVASRPFLLGGGVLLSLVLDGWWRAASPFATLARLLPDRGGDDASGAPAWVAPAMVGSFLWLSTAYHDGGQVRAVGAWLAAYTVAALAGTVRWGRAWAAAGEGFADLFGTVGRLAPVARDGETGRVRLRLPLTGVGGAEPGPGSVATLLVTIGGVVFGAVRTLDWWQLDVVGARSGWARTAVDSIGLAFAAGAAAVVWVAAQRALGPERRGVATGLVAVAAGVVVAFLLTDLAVRAVDVLALLSDPFGRGWDLFGTADWFPDLAWQVSARLAWAEIAALVVGAVLAAVAAHDGALAGAGRRAAPRAAAVETAATTAVALAALVVLLR